MTRRLPPSASVAEPREGARLHSPSALRNQADLAALLQAHAPTEGQALELASGTGQHIGAFAAALPGLEWQPSDVEAARLASIDAHATDSGCANIRAAIHLDATRPGWAADQPPRDLIVLINLLHLIPLDEAQTLIREAAMALKPAGMLMIYGPFSREGDLTSEGDGRFDAELRAADPRIGYKDTTQMQEWLPAAGLARIEMHQMPANNLAFIARKPTP